MSDLEQRGSQELTETSNSRDTETEKSSIRERIHLSRTTFRRMLLFAIVYGISLTIAVALHIQTSASPTDTGNEWAIRLIPLIVFLAFLFEMLDSAAGMGFGTAFSPILLLMGYHPLAVTPVLLISESCSGLLAGYMHHEMGNAQFSFRRPLSFDSKLVALIAVCGILGIALSVIIVYAMIQLPTSFIKTYVTVLVIIMGVMGILRHKLRFSSRFHPAGMAICAGLASFNKGVGGGGYGPVITLGQVFSGVDEKRAVAITNLAEGIISVAGTAVFFSLAFANIHVQLILLPSVIAGSILGSVAAPYLVRIMPIHVFKYIVPLYAIMIGILMIFNL